MRAGITCLYPLFVLPKGGIRMELSGFRTVRTRGLSSFQMVPSTFCTGTLTFLHPIHMAVQNRDVNSPCTQELSSSHSPCCPLQARNFRALCTQHLVSFPHPPCCTLQARYITTFCTRGLSAAHSPCSTLQRGAISTISRSRPEPEQPAFRVRAMTEGELSHVCQLLYKYKVAPPSENMLHAWWRGNPEAWKVAVTEEGTIIGCTSCDTREQPDLSYLLTHVVDTTHQEASPASRRLLMAAATQAALATPFLHDVTHKYMTTEGASARTFTDEVNPYLSTRHETEYEAETREIKIVGIKAELCIPPERCAGVQKGHNVEIQEMTSDVLPAVITYDQSVVGHNRDRLLTEWLNQPVKVTQTPQVSMTLVALTDQNTVCGYVAAQPGADHVMWISPLSADSSAIASSLLCALLTKWSYITNPHHVFLMKNEAAVTADCLNLENQQVVFTVRRDYPLSSLPSQYHKRFFL